MTVRTKTECPLCIFKELFFAFVKFCSTGRQKVQLAITHGLQYVESKLMRVLVVYLAVSMVIQMAEGSTWLSDCEPTWCLSAPLTFFFFFPSVHSVMYSSQPFKVKCHFDCESCLFVRWDPHFHWESLGSRSLLLNSYRASSSHILF